MYDYAPYDRNFHYYYYSTKGSFAASLKNYCALFAGYSILITYSMSRKSITVRN